MLKRIDLFLNGTTMYKIVLYVLIVMVIFSIALGFLGQLSFSGWSMIFSVLFFSLFCFSINWILAKLWGAPANVESSFITALILFFIFSPAKDLYGIGLIFLASLIAIASKYVVAYKKRHIFNPAAFAAVALGFTYGTSASWWVGNESMFPLVLILGLLVVRKMRKFTMVSSFVLVAFIVLSIYGITYSLTLWDILIQVLISWPILFFAFIMFTEPQTLPPTKKLQIIYAIIVGVLFASQWNIGPVYPSPEIALIVGNIFSFIVGFKKKIIAKLIDKKELTSRIFKFSFETDTSVSFIPGQYLEWTIPHNDADIRGNRRFFTIASSPTEKTLDLGVKIPEESSSFKRALLSLENGQTIIASGLAGDFVLPKDYTKKIVGIAGGIGITPFRSMVKKIIDTSENRDFIILYSGMTESDFTYKELLEKGRPLGIKTEYIVTKPKDSLLWKGRVGFITSDLLKELVPDYSNRIFYISGPDAMVTNYKKLLLSIGVSRKNIKTDYFPGFA
jgi:ferredoxin-NADP reductase/Na+-translocating ferredoxin:NAD+ oxidoreductase RnfD subunit